MKKIYMTPIVNVEYAQLTNIICTSFKSDEDTGIGNGGGSNGEAHAPEGDWQIWGEE